MNRTLLPTLLEEWLEGGSLTSLRTEGLSLYEDENHLYVEAHLPGVKSDDIQLSVERGVVWIKAEGKEERKGKVYCQASRSYSYRIALPTRIDESIEPQAHYQDGVLKVTFAKARSARPIKIPVKQG